MIYTQIDKNTHKTFLLMSVFFVFLIGLGWLFSHIFNNYWILIIAVIFSFLLNVFSYWYSDKIVLSITKSKPIEKKDNPELYRIVENLCITAGLPMPKIYIMESNQPNAFATGRDKYHSAVVVTSGLLKKLDRPELEGVIAHELSHIGNRDILLSTVITVMVGTIVLASDLFLRLSPFAGDDDSDRNNILFLVFGIIAAILAPLAATLLQLAISRKREFLADASGALLTRYPEGLARALEKISSDPSPMRQAGNSTAHLFIASPFKGKQRKSWFTKLFMTHPPVEERIKALRNMDI